MEGAGAAGVPVSITDGKRRKMRPLVTWTRVGVHCRVRAPYSEGWTLSLPTGRNKTLEFVRVRYLVPHHVRGLGSTVAGGLSGDHVHAQELTRWRGPGGGG